MATQKCASVNSCTLVSNTVPDVQYLETQGTLTVYAIITIIAYTAKDRIVEWVNQLQDDAGNEDDEHNDRSHPLPHDDPCQLQVPMHRLG